MAHATEQLFAFHGVGRRSIAECAEAFTQTTETLQRWHDNIEKEEKLMLGF